VDAGNARDYAFARAGLDWEQLNENVRLARELRNRHRARTRILCSIVNQKGVDVEAAQRYWTPLADKVQIRKFLTWGVNDPEQSADPAPYLPPEKHIPCPMIFERCTVNTKGHVTFCAKDIFGAKPVGDTAVQSLCELWRSAAYEEARKLHLAGRGHEFPACAGCQDRPYRSWKYNFWKMLEDMGIG
jgi:hypothetical protein